MIARRQTRRRLRADCAGREHSQRGWLGGFECGCGASACFARSMYETYRYAAQMLTRSRENLGCTNVLRTVKNLARPRETRNLRALQKTCRCNTLRELVTAHRLLTPPTSAFRQRTPPPPCVDHTTDQRPNRVHQRARAALAPQATNQPAHAQGPGPPAWPHNRTAVPDQFPGTRLTKPTGREGSLASARRHGPVA